ncbi:heme ABC transporter ATP-binding protein [Brucellaceae bacterium C25G]
MIEVRDLSVTISDKPIISDVSFKAYPRQVSVIVGPNGSGKTTLMRALCGDVAYEGYAFLDGANFRSFKPWQMAARRAVLPQSTSLSFPFSVREIVRLGLIGGLSGVAESEQENLPDMALKMVDLEGFSGRLYQELSGGEQQRVQLARVLCQIWKPVVDGQPRYLFLDEPISSLDIKHQIMVMNIARKFAAEGGGVVAILHDLNLTAMFADQVIIMQNGQLDGAGAPKAMLTSKRLSRIYGCNLSVGMVPPPDVPFILPHSSIEELSGN